MSHLIPVRPLAASLALVAGLAVLTGCGGDDGPAASGQDAAAEVDAGAGKVTVDSGNGTATAGQSLPADFPVAQVPLVAEEVVAGAKGDPDDQVAWSVIMKSDRAAATVVDEADALLAGAGYAEGEKMDNVGVSVRRYTGQTYAVSLTVARTGDDTVITYVVNKAS